eukprot:s6749_g3.t1
MYHLYTVDIVCTGLPLTDLNTLEFEHPDKDGKRKLKYIHAWVWLEWPQIQRYLFEGSELKETKRKGSFANAGALTTWLSQFDLRMDVVWFGCSAQSYDVVVPFHWNEDSLLELWGRHDGVPMLMRVTHVLQLRVTSPEPSLKGKFLFSTWAELLNGKRRVTHTLPAMKKDMPYDEEKFRASAAALATGLKIKYLLFDPKRSLRESEPSGVQLHEVHFVEQRHDVEESPSYRGLFTMYHLYCMEAECSGLPISDFASMDLKDGNIYSLKGWSWSSAQRVMDIMRHRSLVIEREQAAAHAKWRDAGQTCLDCVGRLDELLNRLTPSDNSDSNAARELLSQLERTLMDASGLDCARLDDSPGSRRGKSFAETLPPSMLAAMEMSSIASDKFLEETHLKLVEAAEKHPRAKETTGSPRAPPSKESVTHDGNEGTVSSSSPAETY